MNTVTRGWVGAPNERAPFRFHGAVVGFVDRCLSRTRNLAASNIWLTFSLADLGPRSAQVAAARAVATGAWVKSKHDMYQIHVSDTWKYASLSFVFTHPPEDLKKKKKIGPGIIFFGVFEKFETFFSKICAHSEQYRDLLAGIFEIRTFYGNIAFPLSPG